MCKELTLVSTRTDAIVSSDETAASIIVRRPRPPFPMSRNEDFWLEVIRQASGDSDPPPDLHTVQAVRKIFRQHRRGATDVA